MGISGNLAAQEGGHEQTSDTGKKLSRRLGWGG